jgi:hypothetical protein
MLNRLKKAWPDADWTEVLQLANGEKNIECCACCVCFKVFVFSVESND